MNNLPSSIFYILTGWTCTINIYIFFYKKKLNDYVQSNSQENNNLFNKMNSHYKKADKLGKIFLTLWCFSAVWYFFNLNT